MRKASRYLWLGAVFIFLIWLVTGGSAQSAIPGRMNYQGRLADSSGSPIKTTKAIAFKIYDALSGGTLLWTSSSYSITPDSNGVFSVVLGSEGDPISSGVFGEATRYLEIIIEKEVMSPRIQFATSAFSFKAADSDYLAGLPPSEYFKASGGKITGNLTVEGGVVVSGTVQAGAFKGDGSQLTGIGAAQITDYSVTSTKIATSAVTSEKINDGAVTASKLASGSVTAEAISEGAITSSKLASDAAVLTFARQGSDRLKGNVDIKQGTNVSITQTGQTLEVAASGVLTTVEVDNTSIDYNAGSSLEVKDLGISTAKLAATSVTAAKLGSDVAGSGLTGGNGSALAVDTGTAANKIVQLDGSAKLPAVDGSQLTGVVATSIADNAVSTTKIATSAVTDAKIDSVSGSKVTGSVATADAAGRATSAATADAAGYAVTAGNIARATAAGTADTAGYADNAGNASTVTNGVYTTGSYANPAWITSLAGSKISGSVSTADAAGYATTAGTATTATSATTAEGAGRATSAVTADAAGYATGAGTAENAGYATNAGNATTVTNGVYTTGSYADPAWVTSLAGSKISGSVSTADAAGYATSAGSATTATSATTAENAGYATNAGNASTVTNGVYTTGSYANPAWVMSLAGSKISGSVSTADSAGYATSAGSATTATSATTAEGAGRATSAVTADAAGYATSAGTAATATSATTAENAGYATNAGNASTVTNGVYTTGSYADPAWITSLAGSKISGSVSTADSSGRATSSATSDTAGYSDNAGNASTVTNGVYTTGSYADPTWVTSLAGSKLTDSSITASKLSTGAVTSDALGAGSVITSKLGAGAVTTAEIAGGAVTGAKLASDINITTTGSISAGSFAGNGAGLTNVPAVPGGATGAVQFNSSGTMSGEATNLYYDAATKKLGIGTTTPDSLLDISSDTYLNHLTINRPGAGASFYLTLGSDGTTYLKNNTAERIRVNIGGADVWNISTTGGLSLGTSYVSTDMGSGSMIMSGKLGIGTTSPTVSLEVSGGDVKVGSAGASIEASTGKIYGTFVGSGALITGVSASTAEGAGRADSAATADAAGYATNAGNSSTVTNGVYTTGSYADPAWITSLAGSKLTDGSVSASKLASGAVTSEALGAGAVTTAKISAEAVTTAEIGAGAVTGAKLASDINITSTGSISAASFAGNGALITGVSASTAETAGRADSSATADAAGYATTAGTATGVGTLDTLSVTGNSLLATSTGKVGIGTSSSSGAGNPQLPLSVGGPMGLPATSGTVQTGILRITAGYTYNGSTLDMGIANEGAWMQSTNRDILNIGLPLLINPNGANVSIGTSASTYQLNVVEVDGNNAGITNVLALDHTSYNAVTGGVGTGIALRAGNSGATAVEAANINGVLSDVSTGVEDGFLSFQTKNNGTLTERLRVDNVGKVGIGTTTPSVSLEVNGDVKIGSAGASIEASTGKVYGTFVGDGSLVTNVAAATATSATTADAAGYATTAGTATGVGTLSALSVNGNITITSGNDIRPTVNSTTAINIAQADGTDFVIFDTTNRRMGLGITPTNTLDIMKSGSQPTVRLIEYNDSNLAPVWSTVKVGGTSAAPTATPNAHVIGYFGFAGYDGSAYTGSKAAFQAITGGLWSSTSTPTYLTLSTTPVNSTTLAERVRITSAGNVGIGTTTPTVSLEVSVGDFKVGSAGASIEASTGKVYGTFVGDGSLVTNVEAATAVTAETVTNGVYTTGSYADPAWITSLASTKITGNIDTSGTFGAELAPAIAAGNWTLGTGWESPIAGGVLNKNADGTGTAKPAVAITTAATYTYKVVVVIDSLTVGSYATTSMSLGGVSWFVGTTTGTRTYYITATGNANLIITPGNTDRLQISSISVTQMSATPSLVAGGSLEVSGDLIINGPATRLVFAHPGDPSWAWFKGGDEQLSFYQGGTEIFRTSSSGLFVANTLFPFRWADVLLYRTAPAAMGVTGGSTTPGIFQIYNKYSSITTPANYERFSISGVSGSHVGVTAESAGTGAANLDLILTPKGSGKINLNGPVSVASTVTGNGTIESTVGGFKFPDATIQTTAFTSTGAGTFSAISVTGNSYLASSAGMVGVGTSNPVVALDVNGTIRATQEVLNGGTALGNPLTVYGTIEMMGGDISLNNFTAGNLVDRKVGLGTTNGVMTSHWGGVQFTEGTGTDSSAGNSQEIKFWTSSGGGSSTEKMRIGNLGRVGIGTTAPVTLLDVNGTIKATQEVIGGNTATSLLTVYGTMETKGTGGVKFPDGTTQVTAFNSTATGTFSAVSVTGNIDAAALSVGGTTMIDSNKFFTPVTSDDAGAPNNSIYYSSTQSKLVYKDGAGVVNVLY